MLHGRMKRGGEAEGQSSLSQATPTALQIALDIDSQGCEHIGAAATAGDRTIAMLDDWHAGPGCNQGRRRANVESSGVVAPGAAGIEDTNLLGLQTNHVLP